jgi:hypothetical protein
MTPRAIRARLAAALLAAALAAVIAGCDIRPGNALIFRVAGTRVFNTATLTQLDTGTNPRSIRLRFTDTNVFQYNSALTPGRYKLVLKGERNYTIARELVVKADQWLYEIPAPDSRTDGIAPAASQVKAAIEAERQPQPNEVFVVFVGAQFVVRSARPAGGAFSVDAPPPGTYRVEVHAPGSPPRSWSRDGVEVKADGADLGPIRLP